jgi:hypothetical protein
VNEVGLPRVVDPYMVLFGGSCCWVDVPMTLAPVLWALRHDDHFPFGRGSQARAAATVAIEELRRRSDEPFRID